MVRLRSKLLVNSTRAQGEYFFTIFYEAFSHTSVDEILKIIACYFELVSSRYFQPLLTSYH